MGLFGVGKKRGEIIDYTKRYKKSPENSTQTSERPSEDSNQSYSAVEFFDNLSSSVSENNSFQEDNTENQDTAEERKRRLAKRISDMTDRLEDLSNQIYRLGQRIELIERKLDGNRYGESN